MISGGANLMGCCSYTFSQSVGIIKVQFNSSEEVITMAMEIKMDASTVEALRSILATINVRNQRITIDLEKNTVLVEDDYSNDDLLSCAGILSPEQAKQLEAQIQRNKSEDWD
jgi:hypothetical protein